jgi:hypothetical protein
MHTSYDPVANQVTGLLRYEKWRDGGLVTTELLIPPGRTRDGAFSPCSARLMLEAFGSS